MSNKRATMNVLRVQSVF